MQIIKMNDQHLQQMVKIDQIAFKRDEARIVENLKALMLSDPEGCFVLLDEDQTVGYSYCKTMGSEGYLGPVGLLSEYQNAGYGRKLISKSLDYLKSNCEVIGLEVLPEKGDNIGLYNKMGFISGFPSYLFKFHEEKGYVKTKFQISTLSEFSEEDQKEIIEKIDLWTGKSFNGVSYQKDLKASSDLKGLILIAFDESGPAGFLAYSKTFLPYLWGATKPHKTQKDIMRELLGVFNNFHPVEDVIIQVNSCYTDMVDLLMEMNFKVYRSVNRMFLRKYEGNYLELSDKMIIRGWRG